MPPSISIVIIDKNTESIENIVDYVKKLGNHANVLGTASNFEDGFDIIHRKSPMVVVMDVCNDPMDQSIKNIEMLVNRFPNISIFATCADRSSDTILKVMRAGATEYLLQPVSEVDLTAALQKLGRLWITKPPPVEEESHLYTLFSPKGGVGATTIAINLAVCIQKITKKPTILVDLDLNAGDVTTFLNLRPTYTISDVTTNIRRLDRSFLKGVISKHESGIHVLADPQKVEQAVSISADEIKKVLGVLKTMFSYVVIDTEPIFNARTMTAVEMSDEILLPFVMSLPGIRNMQRYLSYLEKSGIGKNRLKLVVSRYLKKGDIKLEDAEKVFNHSIFATIPNEYDTAMSCLNKGVPVSSYNEKSKLNSAIKDMALAMVGKKK